MNWSLLRWLSGSHQEPSGDRREDRRRGYEAALQVSAAEYRAELLADYVAAQKKTVQTVLSALDEADRIKAVAVTPDGTRAVSASWDGTLMVWDLVKGT